MSEAKTEGGIMPIRIESVDATPRKITQQDITRIVKDVVEETQEQRLQRKFIPSANSVIKSADATTLSRLKDLVPEKARRVLALSAQKAAITGSALYILISSDCGNVDNPTLSEPFIKEPTPVSIPVATESPELNNEEKRFIEKVKTNYGMDVTLELSSYYDTPLSEIPEAIRDRYILGKKPKEYFTEKELRVLREAIETIPFCAKINDRLKIIKDPMLKNPGIESGAKYFIGTTQAKTQKSKSLILLSIRENSPLDGPNLKPYVFGIDTGAEQLKQVYYHECGHAVSFAVLEAAFPEEFFDITHPSKVEARYREEQKNPLYIPFAKLEGWRLNEKIFIKEVPDDNVWVKDTPDNRMTLGYTNLKIAEHFGELFGLYISNSPVLTDEERMFFGKIKKGFEQNPKGFAKAIADDPMMLLRNERE